MTNDHDNNTNKILAQSSPGPNDLCLITYLSNITHFPLFQQTNIHPKQTNNTKEVNHHDYGL